MGFAQFTVGDKLEIHWEEWYGDGSEDSYVAEFNSKELSEVAERVKGLKFTYLGTQTWQLDVYEALHMEEDDRLQTINSTKWHAVVDQRS